jgi:hypothetical protein
MPREQLIVDDDIASAPFSIPGDIYAAALTIVQVRSLACSDVPMFHTNHHGLTVVDTATAFRPHPRPVQIPNRVANTPSRRAGETRSP